MAIKKKTRNVLLILLGIIIVLMLMGNAWKMAFVSVKPFILTPITDFPTETLSPYICDAPYCKVQGKIDCDIPNAQTVTFRTNALTSSDFDASSTWFALYCIPNGNSCISTQNLNGFCYTSSTISGTQGNFVFSTNTGDNIYAYNSDLYINGRKYNSCGLSVSQLSLDPTEPYTSQNCGGITPCQEKVSGPQNRFSCNSIFETYDSLGNLKYSDILSYSGNEQGNDLSSQQTINIGWKAQVSNPTGGIAHLFYGTYEEKESCGAGNKPKCSLDKTGYYGCAYNNGTYYLDKSILNLCDLDNGFICVDTIGNCTFPLTTTLKFSDKSDSSGIEKIGFSPTENIFIKSKLTALTSSQVKNANVNFIIYQYGSDTPFTNYDLGNYDFTKDQYIYTPIINPGNTYLGQQFYAVIAVTYNGKTIYLGKENKDYSFRISTKLTCDGQFFSNINGQTRTSLYAGYPVELDLYTKESNLPSSVDSFKELSINLNTGSQIIPMTLVQTSGTTGTYIYQFTPLQSGQLDSTITIVKSNVETTCIISSQRVEVLGINPTFTNIAKYTYKCAKRNEPLTLDIDVKDSISNYVDVDMSLSVINSNTTLQQDISSSIVRDDKGQYHFTYSFSQTGSTYFQVSSQYFDKVNTGSIDVRDSCQPVECAQNSDCSSKGVGYVCRNNQCVQNDNSWFLYLGIGVGILAVIIIVVLIIKFIRKPKQTISTGLEGL